VKAITEEVAREKKCPFREGNPCHASDCMLWIFDYEPIRIEVHYGGGAIDEPKGGPGKNFDWIPHDVESNKGAFWLEKEDVWRAKRLGHCGLRNS
jgi:hypothetical protein